MNYNFFIPNIYNENMITNKNNKKYNIIKKTIKLTKDKIYNLDNIFNLYDKDIVAFYFKTNSPCIYLSTHIGEILIYNNFILLDIFNCRTDNEYILFSEKIDSEITIYIILNYYLPIKSYGYVFYDKNDKIVNNNTFYIKKINKYYSPYYINKSYNDTRITIDIYFLTQEYELHNKNKIIKFESNNIIFYYIITKIKKCNQKQFLYKLNLIKLENIINTNNIVIDFKYNIYDIDDITSYIDKFLENYNIICDFLFEQHNNDYYYIDLKNFMIKNDIDRLWYIKI
jgi:hypothetical protein